MSAAELHDNMEERILKAARSLFIEKGFEETSMSDIAANVGINRPGLHYYFRTKDKMFHAVFEDIILSIVPKVFTILMQQERPIAQRIEEVVNAYYNLFLQNPNLPMFIIREMNRDVSQLVETATRLHLPDRLKEVTDSLQEEMAHGKLRRVPLPFLFYNLYGLLVMPFLTQNFVTSIYLDNEKTFVEMLNAWKPYIVLQMTTLLTCDMPRDDSFSTPFL